LGESRKEEGFTLIERAKRKSALVSSDVRIRSVPFSSGWAEAWKKAQQGDL
jgi:hypothetical protein